MLIAAFHCTNVIGLRRPRKYPTLCRLNGTLIFYSILAVDLV